VLVIPKPAVAPNATAPALPPAAAPLHRRPAIARLATRLAAAALPVASAISAPLAAKPRIVRDTLGWLALNTLFLGVCVWAYILFVRHPAHAHAPHTFDFATAHLPPVPVPGILKDGAGHGEAAANSAGHAAPAKSDAAHGDSAAATPAKKRTPPQPPKFPDKSKKPAKDAAKPDAPSGH